ncbi:helicase associated domain-containing protein [Streptomyces sp. CBMA156]|uniref:helicase associated domain-containing protein n=1 Tax=Streptomyces sp. CBMA156 TaxID=1930280 RepID=UPI0016618D80|nr:helicase associated domain-containing protein [Streptomyces sp. CBMA156]MBD0675643.1 hypothetical protein [Streptomyces sp. CBMA156]
MWPQQVQAVDAACATLAEHDAASLVITCGGGKTRVGAETAVRIIELIEDLTANRAEFGHTDVPFDYVNPAGRPLGKHVSYRRKRYDQLPAERQKQLASLGFVTCVKDAAWDTFIADLTVYRTEFGHLDVPTNYVNAAGRRLGQKAARHRGNQWDTIPEKRQKLLTTLGFAHTQVEARWSRLAAAWAAYTKETGTSEVPDRHVTVDGLALGCWRQRQLERLRAGKLPSHLTPDRLRSPRSPPRPTRQAGRRGTQQRPPDPACRRTTAPEPATQAAAAVLAD